MNEGSVWEGLMFLSQHQISNVLVFIDNNKQESLARTDDILSIECLEKKIGGMRISAERINGHQIETLIKEINHFLNDSKKFENPRVLICDTVKGKGVSFMEKVPMWHHRKLKENEYLQALKELINNMRNAFSEELIELTKKDDDIILLAGDIGFRIFDKFIKLFPKKFINCGIAEQNMISVAAGLASEGKLPIVYTIVPFLIMRGYEQIRVDIGINSQKVILVGVGGGLAYDKLGSTHHSCEDVALMRTIPNLDVYTPFDPNNVRNCLKESYYFAKNEERASYIRLSKGKEKNLNNAKKISDNIHIISSTISTQNFLITHGNLISKIFRLFQ